MTHPCFRLSRWCRASLLNGGDAVARVSRASRRKPAVHRRRGEDGQVLMIAALLLVVVTGMVGLAVDVGRLYAAKARLSRSADAAALAGARELPDMTSDSDGDGRTSVGEVAQYLNSNEPAAWLSEAPTNSALRQVRVKASLDVDTLFIRVIPGAPRRVTVSASAVAGFGSPLEIGLVLDETYSMVGEPLSDTKTAAIGFANTLLPSSGTAGGTRIAVVPYRAAYSSNTNCTFWTGNNASYVRTGVIVGLTANKGTVTNGINNMSACGYTNVCEGLNRALATLNAGHDPGSSRILVLMTDGDNNPGSNDPAGVCDPVGTSNLYTEDQRDKDLDVKTYDLVRDSIAAAGIEVYIVGFSVEGIAGNELCDTSIIGSLAYSDDTSDRNLLKCLATSDDGTNDHYFETDDSDDLDEIFQSIANELSFRLIE